MIVTSTVESIEAVVTCSISPEYKDMLRSLPKSGIMETIRVKFLYVVDTTMSRRDNEYTFVLRYTTPRHMLDSLEKDRCAIENEFAKLLNEYIYT